jgi:HD-like signal output (HDOD) protein/CheY-like chemotaxis protein
VNAHPLARRLLVVDDDPGRAAELAAMLAAAPEGWQVETALSGRGALAALAARRFDMLITDLRVAGLGSGALLATAAMEHPDVVRMVRSAAGVERPMLAAACAHQFLAEPLDERVVVAQVARAFALRDTLGASDVRAIVGRMTAIPTLPALYTAVAHELSRLHVSGRRIGEIVSGDPAMAAKVLQMVNSPFFGRQMRVSDPGVAVQLLGLETIRGLVLSTHVFETFRRPARGALDIEQLWQHASSVGTIAGSLAEMEGGSAELVQDARTAGLLHDVGKLLLVATLPVVSMRVRERARREGRPTVDVEREEFGVTHAELGGYLLGLWGLPDPVVEATAWHHQAPSAAPRGSSALSFVVAANVLASVPRKRAPVAETEPLMSRLAQVLSPFGLTSRAASWLDWTLETAAA